MSNHFYDFYILGTYKKNGKNAIFGIFENSNKTHQVTQFKDDMRKTCLTLTSTTITVRMIHALLCSTTHLQRATTFSKTYN